MTTTLPVAPASAVQPSAPPPTPSLAPSSALGLAPAGPSLPPKDVGREIQNEIQNLESKDESTLMKASAALVMLATLAEAEPHLLPAVPRLVPLLQCTWSVHVQRNACAALTAVMNASPMLYLSVLETPFLAAGLVECLKTESGDIGLQINASAAISVLAQRNEGLALLKEFQVVDTVIFLLGSSTDVRLQEEVVDAICALAVHEQMRPILLLKGAVPKLASHLGATSSEVCVRVLLALGMLCGSSPDGQAELAATNGAVDSLLALMKSSDHDIKSISHDLFGALSSNERVRSMVE